MFITAVHHLPQLQSLTHFALGILDKMVKNSLSSYRQCLWQQYVKSIWLHSCEYLQHIINCGFLHFVKCKSGAVWVDHPELKVPAKAQCRTVFTPDRSLHLTDSHRVQNLQHIGVQVASKRCNLNTLSRTSETTGWNGLHPAERIPNIIYTTLGKDMYTQSALYDKSSNHISNLETQYEETTENEKTQRLKSERQMAIQL